MSSNWKVTRQPALLVCCVLGRFLHGSNGTLVLNSRCKMALFQSIISDILALSQRFDFPDDGQQTAVDATHVLPLFFTVSGCEGPPPLVRPLPLLSGAGIRAPLLGCHPTWRYTCRTHQRDVTEGLAPSLEVEAMGMRRNSAAAVCKDKTLPSKETYKSSRRLINISVSNFPPPFHSPNYFTLL